MNNNLLTLFMFFYCLTLNSQTENREITGFKNGQKITRNYSDAKPENNSIENRSVKFSPNSSKASNIQVVTATKFTSSMNAFGVLISESKPLQYNPAVNAVTFIHRKSPTYIASSNSNSGSIVGMISVNLGNTWDSTCIWTSAVNFAHYPQGGIYNPLGNTNKNNAYILGTGAINSGAGWIGNWYSSKSLNGAGNATPGSDQQAHINAAPVIKQHDMSRYSFTSIDGGFVRSVATIVNDINATTQLAYGIRGAAIVKGIFSAGAFTWSVDSFVPCVMQRSNGSKYLNDKPLQAWSDNGQIGYVAMLGVRCGANPCQKSYQPIVYKTTNSGLSWSLLPAGLFNNPLLTARLEGIKTNSNGIVPYFSTNEGWDATVDINGDLHIAGTIVGAYSSHNDSLDYVYSYGTEKYSYKSTNLKWPTIYDFKTKAIGGWEVMIVDSMYSEGPSGILGEPGYISNPWTDGSGAKLDYNARIQMSRTPDGKKILYSWSESDSSLLGLRWNAYPNIMMRGYDVSISKVTGTYDITSGVSPVDAVSYFHYMSNKAIGSSSTCIEVPFTCVNAFTGWNGSQPINIYYLKGAQLCPPSFSISNMFFSSLGVCSITSSELHERKNILQNSFSVYPNPSSGEVVIQFESGNEKTIDAAIIDYTGKVVKVIKLIAPSGTNTVNLDISGFETGIYLIHLNSGQFSATGKIIKE